jgi:HEAT repeat protein
LVALLRDEYSFVREAAAHALGQLGDARAVEPLVAALRERDRGWPIRQAAAHALGQLGDARAVEPLVAALWEEYSQVREAAAHALTLLGWQPGNDTQRALYAIIHFQWEDVVRLGAAAVEPLVAVLREEHGAGRGAAEAL